MGVFAYDFALSRLLQSTHRERESERDLVVVACIFTLLSHLFPLWIVHRWEATADLFGNLGCRMIQLFLSKPIRSNEEVNDNSAEQRLLLFNQLENIIWTLLTSEGRSEARLWLCDAVSSFCSITPKEQHDLFMNLLRSELVKHNIAAQLWQMIFEKRPHEAGSILAKKSHILERFFEGHPRRILQWFSNFSLVGESGHGKGARALSQFAFVNRDICWEELEWKGKHGQSPAVVATKPHYFLDLDVHRTVENFLENVPEFWSSDEFANSLNDGEILSIDKKFFVDLFINLMFEEPVKQVWDAISEFLMEESFSYLCHHLLIVLDEPGLCFFLENLHDFLSRKKGLNLGKPSNWLEIVLSKCSSVVPIDQLLLLNAVFNKGRRLLQLLHNDEFEDEKMKIKDLGLQFCTISYSLALIPKESSLETKIVEIFKQMGLFSWILLYRMSEECNSLSSWESLFINNGIGFRRMGKYGLLQHDNEQSEESGSDLVDGALYRVKQKKRRKSGKKRKRNFGDDEKIYEDELLLDFDDSGNRLNVQSRTGSWLLSTDGYSTSWSMVDLPEYLSQHCLSTWMKQAFTS
ncbi:hypothetical protein Nepgr_029805 [Nepenthes gracilis]|uniref:Uncharacterized protein n=1 Tax=Nepenthes gracilis TaxID=150966 RepID=A0AAD3TG08_NEPGR|nr:hypothetical protein Nepgr_029805 [Nepenthes gracilis]